MSGARSGCSLGLFHLQTINYLLILLGIKLFRKRSNKEHMMGLEEEHQLIILRRGKQGECHHHSRTQISTRKLLTSNQITLNLRAIGAHLTCWTRSKLFCSCRVPRWASLTEIEIITLGNRNLINTLPPRERTLSQNTSKKSTWVTTRDRRWVSRHTE